MSEIFITKKHLIAQLMACDTGNISAQQLQDWMINHFDPPDVKIGLGETQWTQEAMNTIMNEYELVNIAKFKKEGVAFALAFLECNNENFYRLKNRFIHDGFSD